MTDPKFSKVAIAGGLTVAMCLALAAILLLGDTDHEMERLGLFFGVLGTVVAALIGMMRADQGAKQTNGSLDARIESAVYRAQNVRRAEIESEKDG
jgi:hypothetical protein